jgi:glucose-1-phosphate thymidylyltransferase
MIVSEYKTELIRYFGNGSRFGLPIAYVAQPSPDGLAAAVTEAAPWIAGANVCLALPDSTFRPSTAISRICDHLVKSGADLVLGVFPTQTPERFGVVRMDGAKVVAVMEKPAQTDLRNAWGIAAWNERFTRLLQDSARELRTLSITNAFHMAVESGLDVQAVYFEDGQYIDIGTVDSLSALVLRDS